MHMSDRTDTLVIGAGPAGLAVAACLAQRGQSATVIEKADTVAASWRAHYERLHLHTVKDLSALPGLPFPEATPRYVPRRGVVDYLAEYAKRYGITPCFGEEAVAITPAASGWQTSTATGREFVSRSVVLATGANNVPKVPVIAGRALFQGRVLHSRDYRSAAPFRRATHTRGRHGQHRRRDRARSCRTRRAHRTVGALTGESGAP